MRVVHVLSAIIAVGGLMFLALCLNPAVRLLDDKFRDTVVRMTHHRFTRVVWVAFAGLLVSGAYNWVLTMPTYKAIGPIANIMIGTKALLALILMAVTWAGSAGMIPEKACRMINVHVALVIIILAAVLRHIRLEHLAQLANQA